MPINPLPLLIFHHNPIQRIAHIRPDIRIIVLVQTECAARVLDEQMQKSDFVIANLWELACDFRSYEVGAAAFGGEGNGLLGPRHG